MTWCICNRRIKQGLKKWYCPVHGEKTLENSKITGPIKSTNTAITEKATKNKK